MTAPPCGYGRSAAERILAALAFLGGQGTTTEVHRVLGEDGGYPVSRNRVTPVLNMLARRTPQPVTRTGKQGAGNGAGTWRLGAPGVHGNAAPERKRRHEPQPETPGRAPLCPECLHLLDALGHVWACVAPGGKLRRRAMAGPRKAGAA